MQHINTRHIVKLIARPLLLFHFIDALDVINKHGKYSPIGLRAGGLSQGEVQKVSLARAFIRKPQILILDEPTAYVDYESAIDLIDAIKNFQTNNHSLIIICSHDVRLNSASNNIVDLAKNNSNIM